MNRVLGLAFLIIAAVPSARSVDHQAPAPASEAGALPEIGRELSSFFEQDAQPEVTAEGMTSFRSEHNHVIVARVGTDGKISTECVVTSGAAHKLLAPRVRDGAAETSRLK